MSTDPELLSALALIAENILLLRDSVIGAGMSVVVIMAVHGITRRK